MFSLPQSALTETLGYMRVSSHHGFTMGAYEIPVMLAHKNVPLAGITFKTDGCAGDSIFKEFFFSISMVFWALEYKTLISSFHLAIRMHAGTSTCLDFACGSVAN